MPGRNNNARRTESDPVRSRVRTPWPLPHSAVPSRILGLPQHALRPTTDPAPMHARLHVGLSLYAVRCGNHADEYVPLLEQPMRQRISDKFMWSDHISLARDR